MLAAEKSRSTFIAPIGIGLALFIAEMLGGELLFSLSRRETDKSDDSRFFSGFHWRIPQPCSLLRSRCRHKVLR